MARLARVVVPGAPHHVTQRGNRRRQTFFREEDYLTCLHLAAEAFGEAGVEVWAYCLMPNHVHLIAAPSEPAAPAAAVGATHLRYTRQINRRERWTGYLWQGRNYSDGCNDPQMLAGLAVKYCLLPGTAGDEAPPSRRRLRRSTSPGRASRWGKTGSVWLRGSGSRASSRRQ